MIRIENLVTDINGRRVFNNFCATINNGDIVGLIGPSGSGKSFLLRSIMMLSKPSSGHIYLDDEDLMNPLTNLDEARKKIGMVFQDFNLFSNMSVLENVMSGPLYLQNVQPDKAYEEAMELIKSVGLYDRAFAFPNQLSGGQQQRAAIARTMAMKPDHILLDEPTSALDPVMRGEVEAVIRMMAASGKTMLIATHEMDLVRSICNRVFFLDEGVVYEEGTPEEIFDRPQKDKTRRFVQALRVLEFNIESKNFDFIGSQTTIREFAYRNGVPALVTNKLMSIMEELSQMIIMQQKQQNKMHVSFEYNNKDQVLNGEVLFTGPKFDPDNPLYVFSWPIICMRASDVSYGDADAEGYTNKINLSIK